MTKASPKDSAGEVAVKDEAKLPAADQFLDMLEEDGGDLGFSSDDLVIPFFRILQQLSPQLNSRNALYISGAKSGDFIITATQDILAGDEGITVLPVCVRKSYTEWVPREKGGGLVHDYGADASILERCQKDERNRDVTVDGNLIKSSYMYYALVQMPSGEWQQAVIDFSSTQRRKAKTWNTRIQGISLKASSGKRFTPPMYYMTWKLSTVAESNDQGDWFGFKIERHVPVFELEDGKGLYEEARDFEHMIATDIVKVDPNAQPEDEDRASGQRTGNAASADDDDDEIPF